MASRGCGDCEYAEATDDVNVISHNHHEPARWLDADRGSALLLLGVASFLTWASLTGRVSRCVAPRYAWFAPCGAVLISAMGLALLLQEAGRSLHEHDHTGGCCPSSRRKRLLSLAILALPFVTALIVDPVRLSSEGMRKRQVPKGVPDGRSARGRALANAIDWVFGGAASAGGGASAGANVSDAEVEQLLRNATVRDVVDLVHSGRGKLLEGRFVSLIGMAEPSAAGAPGRFDLMRVVVVCCVADATAVSLDVAPLPGTAVEPGQWVRADGIIRFDDGESFTVPVLHASTVVVIEEPSYPYL